MPLKWIPRAKSGASKSRPHWVAHTRIGNIWGYPPPLGLTFKLPPSPLNILCTLLSPPLKRPTCTLFKTLCSQHHQYNITDRTDNTNVEEQSAILIYSIVPENAKEISLAYIQTVCISLCLFIHAC